MAMADAPQRIEGETIQPIPASERHGLSRDLFTIWFGPNIMLPTVVTGALATTGGPGGIRWPVTARRRASLARYAGP